MIYMGIFDTDPRADAQVNKDGSPVKKPVYLAPLTVVEFTETATLNVRGEDAQVTADRRGYHAEGWRRAFTYGEQRDVMDGAKSEAVCLAVKVKGLDGKMVPAPLNHTAEAVKHAKRILSGYYSGDIVSKGSMDDTTRNYRVAVYNNLIANKLTEQKIGTLGTTRESITAAGITAGFTAEQLAPLWVASVAIAETLKAARGLRIELPIEEVTGTQTD